jgi:hypothetical protein
MRKPKKLLSIYVQVLTEDDLCEFPSSEDLANLCHGADQGGVPMRIQVVKNKALSAEDAARMTKIWQEEKTF